MDQLLITKRGLLVALVVMEHHNASQSVAKPTMACI